MTDQLPESIKDEGDLVPLSFLNLGQVADELNTTEFTINSLIDSGRLQVTRVGKRRQ